MKWLKRLGLALGVLVLLLGVLLAVATCPGFLNSVVVPWFGREIQTEIRIGSLESSLFSGLQAGEVRVGPADVPLLQGKLLRVRGSLLAALLGQVRVDEIRLDDTAIHIVKRADGSTNLPVLPPWMTDDDEDDEEDALPPLPLPPQPQQPAPPRQPAQTGHTGTSKASSLRLGDVWLSGVSFVYEQRQGAGQEPILVKLSNLSLKAPEVTAGKEVTLTLAGQIDEVTMGGVSGVKGTVSGDCRMGLSPDLAISAFDLVVRFRFSQGSANAIDLAGREVRLEVQTAAERGALAVRRVAVSEWVGDRPEAALALSGRVQWKPADVQLDVVADPLESAAFGIAGALLGDLSFGAASGIYHANAVMRSPRRLRPNLRRIRKLPWTNAVSGRLDLRSLSPRSEKWGLHDVIPFDAHLEHEVAWHTDGKLPKALLLAAHADPPNHEMLRARATLEVAAAAPRPTEAAGKALPAWAAQLAGATVVYRDRVALESLTLRAQAGESALANLSLSGSIAAAPGCTELTLNSDLLDLSGLLGVAVRGPPAADTAKQPGKEKPAAAPAPTSAVQPAALGPGPFNTGAVAAVALVDLKHVTYGEITGDVACTIRLGNSVVTVEALKGLVSGSPLSGGAKANLAVQGLDYAANLTVGALDLAPLLRTFAADLAPSIQGALTGMTLELTGRGTTPPAWRRTLRGRFEAGAQNLVVQGLRGQTELAQRWGIPELERVQVAQFDLRTRIQDGKIMVDTCREVSPDHTVTVEGSIGLDASLALDVGAGVGGALQTRLSQSSSGSTVMNYLVLEGDHLVTPVPIPIKGRIGKPRIDSERFLSRLAKAMVPGLLKGHGPGG